MTQPTQTIAPRPTVEAVQYFGHRTFPLLKIRYFLILSLLISFSHVDYFCARSFLWRSSLFVRLLAEIGYLRRNHPCYL